MKHDGKLKVYFFMQFIVALINSSRFIEALPFYIFLHQKHDKIDKKTTLNISL